MFFAQNNGLEAFEYNFTSFYKREKAITPELLSLTPEKFQSHPDFGILPKNAPKGTYIELIHMRTDSSRYYVDVKSPKNIAIQKGYGPINFKDSNGNLREIDFSLFPSQTPGIYETSSQPSVITIDTLQKQMSISVNGSEFTFSKNLKLIYENSSHIKTVLANGNWSQFKIGSNGFYISDFFPNIDFYGIVNENQVKTNFKIKSAITAGLSNGYLIISDDISSEVSTQYIPSNTLDVENKFSGDLQIINTNNNNFTIHEGICFDNTSTTSNLFYRKFNNTLEMLVDLNWINSSSVLYPITIDPTISTNNTLAQASCSSSQYNGTCNFVNSCDYNLTVATPANTTISDIQWSFDYVALGGGGGSCRRDNGAVKFAYLGCISPSAAGFFWFCNVNTTGICSGANVSLWPDFNTCVPAPSCTPYNMTFTMKFFRSCDTKGGGCRNDCIASNSPWTMTVFGKTLETLANNTTGNGSMNLSPACNTTQVLNPSAANGVGPYTYLWAPGGQTTSTKSISTFFLGTQVYSCQVTDACGTSRVATFSVTPACVLPIELVSFNGNVNFSNVNLYWETASEINASHYILERSYDGVNFEKIAKINAKGESTTNTQYFFNDTDADLSGIIYYRLKQFGFSSSIEEFSSIISVEPDGDLKTFDVFPNPSNGIYEIIPKGNYSESMYNIHLYNSVGEEILNLIDLKWKSNINLTDKPNGIYFLKIDLNGKFVYKNLIKE